MVDALDTTGDGCVDTRRIDTTGDGHANAVGFDTTGDGKIDAFDTTNDGRIDAWDTTVSLDASVGVALINVAEDGENQIVVVPGANGCLTRQDVEQFSQLIAEADVLLLQLEIPMDCVLHAIGIAKNCKTRVILDTAPVPDHWSEELFDVDLICPNETEAAALAGQPVETTKQAETAARTLHQFGARAVAITLGSSGTLLHDGMSTTLVEPFETDSVDATAAGDAFAGAVAVHWVESGSLPAAIRFGNAAGSLAASRTGAQPSLPKRAEIDMKHLK